MYRLSRKYPFRTPWKIIGDSDRVKAKNLKGKCIKVKLEYVPEEWGRGAKPKNLPRGGNRYFLEQRIVSPI